MYPASGLSSDAELNEHIRLLISTEGRGAESLSDLTRFTRGAYPTVVRGLASQVMEANQGLLRQTVLGFTTVSAELSSARSVLPIPHPLDFEWRFADVGWQRLKEEITRHSPRAGAKVALFGTSGLAEVLPDMLPRHRVTLFERRAEACRALANRGGLSIMPGDIGVTTIGQAKSFDVVVADPPWYPQLVELFVRAAARVLAPAGTLLLCLPGIGTRPGIPAELIRLIDLASSVGLAFDSRDESAVVYESPPFEIAALAAAGLAGFDPLWRRSDLVTFRNTTARKLSPAAPSLQVAPSAADWQEVTIGPARIRLDVLANSTGADRLESIVSGDVLDTVSSRDPRRALANVWTTANRIFRTSDPNGLLFALRQTAAGGSGGDNWSEAVSRLVGGELEHLSALGIE